ncbi:type IX secretion system membrane protein PorP/SprF [Persicitalea sp.]|uniref:PorP/SprF family type IX secretion system membrane protein n=1 Tax=Persicitalea sp. TaxID=3100273 RepID=UPI0035934801
MKVRAWLLWGCAVWMMGKAEAQQLPQGSLYTLNPFVVNPALSGAYDFADVRLSYRRQWMGLDDAPNTAYLTAHTPIGYGDKVPQTTRTPRYANRSGLSPTPPVGSWRFGAGAVLLADRTGPTERNIAQLTGAAHISLPGDWLLSAGLGAGILQYNLRFDRITTATPSDPILPDGRISLLKPYFSAGMLVRKGNFWAGISVLSPLPVSLAYAAPSGAETTSKVLPHYYLTAAYRLNMAEEWALIPQVWVKRVGKVPLSVDGQLRVQYADRLWGGVQYRASDSFGAVLGMALSPNFTINYAYEYPLSAINSVSSGSHEILLGFRFNNRAAIYCPPMGW